MAEAWIAFSSSGGCCRWLRPPYAELLVLSGPCSLGCLGFLDGDGCWPAPRFKKFRNRPTRMSPVAATAVVENGAVFVVIKR